jgi:hypothetical protein
VLIPRSNARLSIGSAWASGSVQLIDFDGSPNVIVPKITLETFRPDFPSLEIWCQLRVSSIFLLRRVYEGLRSAGVHTGRIPFELAGFVAEKRLLLQS